ncbi:Glycoside hydrolase family 43 [Macrophomina phaseolina MS6]|uniref:Glycoside hydrolase family 43 n=1 Tax=Macrophomina phaseolina (strain MS6) TaxID=1126212 RepID=K2SPP5_MACPH|nr:Glycoside hydrolase family 43 [Macrophomina phaseolina MS6]
MVSLGQLCLILKILAHSLHALTAALRRSIRAKLHSRIACRTPAPTPTPQDRRKTVLIVGASFAGYHAARLLAAALPPATHHVVIVEPRSHFHYTWGLPRYSVVPGHEEQAFIPYGGYLGAPSRRAFTWVRDKVIDSTGQKPASGIIADLSPSSIAESGYIQVKPTMQIADGCLPNVYIAGDVAKTDARNGNARSAMEQATVAADNILLAIRGQKPRFHYQSSWVDASILLTLGLKKDVMYISDGEAELLFNLKSKGPSMNAAAAWRLMGAKPFVDNESVEERLVKCP